MNLWDRVKILFGADPAKFVSPKVTDGKKAASEPTLPYIIPAQMLNTISFSTDLTKFYFIDQEKLVSFPLNTRKGVSIGLVNEQLAVVTPLVTVFGEPFEGETIDPVSTGGIESRVVEKNEAGGKEQKIVISIKENNQYTVTYHRATRSLMIIGATDIISTRDEIKAKPSVSCEVFSFNLANGPVNLIRKGDNLIFTARG